MNGGKQCQRCRWVLVQNCVGCFVRPFGSYQLQPVQGLWSFFKENCADSFGLFSAHSKKCKPDAVCRRDEVPYRIVPSTLVGGATSRDWVRQMSVHAGRGRQIWDSDCNESDLEIGKLEQGSYLQLDIRSIFNKVKGLHGRCKGLKDMRKDYKSITRVVGKTRNQPGKRFLLGGLWTKISHTNPNEPVLPILKKWDTQANPFRKKAIVIAISALKRTRRFKQGNEVMEWIWKRRPFELNELDHLGRLYFKIEVGKIEEVENCFAEIPSQWQREPAYTQLISYYISMGMMVKAKNTLAKLKASGKLVSAAPYNLFMAVYRLQVKDNKVFKMFEELKTSGLCPDMTTYNILINVKNRKGDFDGMQKLFEEMMASRISPNVSTLSTMGKSYIEERLDADLKVLTKGIENSDTRKSCLTLELLLSLYAEQGNIDKVEKLWMHISSFNIISFRCYGVMIEALGKLGQIQRAVELADDVKTRKGRLTIRIFNALLAVYSRHGMVQAAEDLVVRIHQKQIMLNAVSYHHLIVVYLKVDAINKALEILKRSQDHLVYHHSKPWLDSLLLILDAFAQKGETEKAEQVFCAFTSPGHYRNTKLYNKLLKAYLIAGNPEHGMLQRMAADGISSDEETFALIKQINSLMGSGEMMYL